MNMQTRLKHLLIASVLFLTLVSEGYSQPPISLTPSMGTYTPIPSGQGTILPEASNGEAISTISGLPFSITYNNTSYSTLYVTTYGTISFNRPQINYIPVFIQPDGNSGGIRDGENLDFIAVFWDAFVAFQSSPPLSKVQYIIEGSPGSRTLTIEWDKLFLPLFDSGGNPYYTSGDEVLSFQIKFFENNENIEFKYKKNNSFTNGYPGGRPVGLQFLDNTYLTVTELSMNAQLSQNNTNYIPYINNANDGLTLLFHPTPIISISAPAASLSSCYGATSTPTTFTVSGSDLIADLTLTAPSNFEISETVGGVYSSNLSLANAGTISQTIYVRMKPTANFGTNLGTISASTTAVTPVGATVSGTVFTKPTLSYNSISLCTESTYLVAVSTVRPVDNGWSATGPNTMNNGYVTAGTTAGTYTVSYTDACAQTASATLIVSSTSTLPAIADGQVSYKFDGSPKGPSSASYFVGYNGFTYLSPNKPSNVGFYLANIQSGNNAGCPYRFYIFNCTTCSN
jgi:hypothetical protein